MKIREIYDYINEIAPYEMQLGFDNSGLNIGSADSEVNKIGVCIDLTNSAVDFAIEQGIDLIISHHPVIWNGLKNIDEKSVVYRLIRNGISALSAHTNYDCAKNGVCEQLCRALDIKITENAYLDDFGDVPIARLATLENPMNPDEFAAYLKQRLNAPDVRYNADRRVMKIGVFNGAGTDLIPFALSHGADTVITSDVKHHEWIAAQDMGINLYDAGHFCTEYAAVLPLCERINERFGDICVSIPQTAPYKAV